MQLQTQIKKYRNELSLSQDELAEKIFVSRQSISNWENGKTYPDIRSLLLLSEVFGVSLDQLVKGDIEIMKKEIRTEEISGFKKNSYIFAVIMLLLLVLPIPLGKLLGWRGLALYVVIFAAGIVFSLKLERQKKEFNIQTYKEISAFMDGQTLEEIEKAREDGKRPYQKILAAVICGVIALAVCALMAWLIG